MRVRLYPALVFLTIALSSACGGGSPSESEESSPSGGTTANPGNVSLDKNSYPVFPDADAGADPSVPADQGGRGFTGEGWETNTDFDLIGDPRAVKGGVFREYILDFPGTLRVRGPESNSSLNYMIQPLVYEGLLGLHPTTLEYLPALATHWQVSPDRMTYRFRIDPNARFADGVPVSSEDVVATWAFMMDKGLQDPSAQLVYGKFQRPVAESKYIVRVTSTQLNWRNFLYFASSMYVLPAHVLKSVDGAAYLRDYNFKLLPGTGPYTVNESDVVKGQSVSVRRRKDYWGAKQRRNVGTGNFDEIRETVVRDQNLAFEMFKKGDLDYYSVNIARQWVQEMDFDRVRNGLIQKRKIFNESPTGISGLAFNARRPPYDDLRVRQALTHLFNRELLIQKLFFNEYVPLNSYYAGLYENPDNPKNPYDPQLAMKLLGEAGWNSRDGQGRLVRGGRPLAIELLYSQKTSEPFLTVYQEELRKVGIGLNLRLVTGETMFKLIMDRRFDLVYMGWGGLLFPNPETSFHSTLADVNNNNNITGVKDARLDKLLDMYDVEFDQQKRVAIIREIDGILANLHHYVLGWDAPFHRIAYWNKFGQPDGYLSRVGDPTDLPSLWWIDPEKEQRLRQAMGDSAMKLEVGPTEVRYWLELSKQRPAPAAPGQ